MPTSRNNSDDDEFIRMLTDHQPSLRAYVVSLMQGLPGVSDVVQEANLTLWKKRDQFRPGSNFVAWSFAVARYSVLEHRRGARKSDQLVFSDELVDALAVEPEEDGVSESYRRQQALETCMQKLTDKDRELIQHRYSKGSSLESLAQSLGRKSSGLRVALYRVRNALRRCINQQLAHPEGTT